MIENMPLIDMKKKKILFTVRKSRDPAILDREELFLQLQNEEINGWENFFYPVSKSVSTLDKRPYSSTQLKLAYYDKTIRTLEIVLGSLAGFLCFTIVLDINSKIS